MNTIIPAIIPESLSHLDEAVATLHGCAPEIQIDIVDGVFVPFRSWPYQGGGAVQLLRKHTEKFQIEVDLMIEAPEKVIPLYIKAGVQKVVVHLESVQNLNLLFSYRLTHPYTLGISISNTTPLQKLFDLLPRADYVQLMGIREIGTQGQPFDTEVLTRIAEIRQHNPSITISIDGSVNRETLPKLREAGANRFVAGSAIFAASDPVSAYEALVAL